MNIILFHLKAKFLREVPKENSNQIRNIQEKLKVAVSLRITKKAPEQSETCSVPSHASKREIFAKPVNCVKPLKFFAKHFILGIPPS